MEYENKTKTKLISEIKELSQKVIELEKVKAEYKEEKKELIRTQQFYKNILNYMDDPVVVKDENHRWVFLNDALYKFWGRDKEELIGKSDYDIFPKEEADIYWEKDNKVFETGKADLNEETQTIDGKKHIISTKKSLYVDTHTGEKYIVGTIRDITDSKMAEEEIGNLARFPSENPNPVLRIVKDGIVLYANEASIQLLDNWGCKIGQFVPIYWKKLIKESLEAGQNKMEEIKFGDRIFSFVLAPVVDAGYVNIYAHDITGRKKVEEALRESEELMRLVIDTSPTLIFVKDHDGNFVLVNKKGAEVHGKTPETMVGRNEREFADLSTNTIDEINKFLADDRQIIDSQVPKFIPEEPLTLPDGTKRWLQTTKIPITIKDVPAYVLGVAVDITERKRAEEDFKKERNMLRTLIDNVPDLIYIKDIESRFVHGNIAIANLMGAATPEDLNWKTDFDYDPKKLAAQYYADEQEVIRTGKPQFNREEPLMDSADRKGWLSTTQVPLKDANGKIMGIVGIGRDITERKRLEEQLQIRQRMDSLGTLAGGVAHDFNNLLTGIIGYLDILLNINKDGLSESQEEYIENALKSCQRAADLVKQFQSLSRSTISKKTNIDLYEASIEVLNMLNKTTDKLIEKKIDFKPGEFYINANPSELNQVLLNLGTNAVKAIEERSVKPGDYIRIRAKEYSITGKDRAGLTEGEYVHIYFEDNGIGMPDEVRRQAFDPLFTTRDKSTQKGQGLGLAMVYNIVTRHQNGNIDIETVEGKGTTFHIYLPKALSSEEAESKEVIVVVGGNETVLIVEDEEMVQNLAKEVLENYGYKVLTALNGKQGLDIFNTNKEPIDLVLLDLTMPEMSGQTVLEEMLKISPDVKVIVSSGHSQEDTRKGILSKAKSYVSKPYKPTDLAQTVRTVLDL